MENNFVIFFQRVLFPLSAHVGTYLPVQIDGKEEAEPAAGSADASHGSIILAGTELLLFYELSMGQQRKTENTFSVRTILGLSYSLNLKVIIFL